MAYTDEEELKRKMGIGSVNDPSQTFSSLSGSAPQSQAPLPSAPPQGSLPKVGAGGTGNWTNFQAYLKANQGNTGSSQLLSNKTNSVFDQEKQNLTQKQNEIKSQASQAVETNRVGQDQASKMIETAGINYQYPNGRTSGTQSTYDDVTGKLKGSLAASYQGPSQFIYGQGADTQNYGSSLSDDSRFGSLMDSLYGEAAGGRIGKGQLALQRQMDVGDETASQALTQVRNQALSKYSGLQDEINSGISSTQDALTGYESQFKNDQSALKDYLSQQGRIKVGNIDNQVSDAKRLTDQFIKANQLGLDAYRQDFKAKNPNLGDSYVDHYLNQLGELHNNYVGDQASRENVGTSHDRNQYNAIMDVLGLSDRINSSDKTWKLGSLDRGANFNMGRNPDGSAVIQNFDKDLSGDDWLRALGLTPEPIVGIKRDRDPYTLF